MYAPFGAAVYSHAWQVVAVPVQHPSPDNTDPHVAAIRIESDGYTRGEHRMVPLDEFESYYVPVKHVSGFVPVGAETRHG